MGDCPCGDYNGHAWLPAPNGEVYVIQVHPGCPNCGYGSGVVIYRFSPEDAEEWGVQNLPRLDVHGGGVLVPVLDASKMTQPLLDIVQEALGEQIAEAAGEALQETCDEWATGLDGEKWVPPRIKQLRLGETR